MQFINKLVKLIFFGLIVKPLVLIVLGLNIRKLAELPEKGPAIITANHNSHLDTLVLMSLYPLHQISKLRPVAAADYFLRNKLLAWFALNVIGIIPLKRSGFTKIEKLFDGCHEALNAGHILIVFPEGSRGEPEQLGKLKKGIYYLIKDMPNVPITPVLLHGLGRALPKGEGLLVPYNCDVVVGKPIVNPPDANNLVETLALEFERMAEYKR